MARRGENIYKRKDGRWEGRYIKEKMLCGNSKYGYVYAKTYSEVKEKLLHKKTELSPNDFIGTISEISYRWLNSQRHFKPSTYAKYRNIIDNHICPMLGKYKFAKIDNYILQQFIEYLTNYGNKNTGGGLSLKSTKDVLSVLKNILYSVTECNTSILFNFDKLNLKSKPIVTQCFNSEQLSLIVTSLTNNINYISIGILLSIYTGIRIGELCALKFEDILFQDELIHISKTLQRIQTFSDEGRKTEIIITKPKSISAIRDIPIPRFLIELIRQNTNCQKEAFMLTGSKERFIEPRTLENKFNKILNTCNIQGATFHTIRHTFATSCVEAGVDIKTLSEILGHSTVNITLNRYVHSTIKNKKSNMEKFYSYQSFSPSILSSLN